MSRCPRIFLLVALLVACVLAPARLPAQVSNGLPPFPPLKSPVDAFRELLAMTPAEREKNLANRKPEARQRIGAKLSEYQSLQPDEREWRLRATELRWWLMPLMRQPATNRAAGLSLIPAETRKLVEDRLLQWDLLPPDLQQELLANEEAARLLTQIETSTAAQREKILTNLPPGRRLELEAGLERWEKMSVAEQRATCERFERFFELTAREQKKVLGTFTEVERQQMEQTLQSFKALSREQRQACVRSFEKFASMSLPERQQFLKNAERWRQMSPSERADWRKLVSKIPEWPPFPPGFGDAPPPMPPTLPRSRQPTVTNGGG